MRIQWMTAALLGSALVVGCGDRGSDNPGNLEQNGTPAAAAPGTEQAIPPDAPPPALAPAAPSPGVDTSRAQETSGNRTATPTRPAPSARPSNSVAESPRAEAPTRRPDPPRPVVRMVTIPAGTALPLELTTSLSSETATVEMPISARLNEDVTVNGLTAIPAGSVFDGEVVEVERAGRVQGRARLSLRFTSVTIGNTARRPAHQRRGLPRRGDQG